MSNLLDFEKAMVTYYQDIVKEIEINTRFIQDHKTSKSQWDRDICATLEIDNRALINQRNNFFEILWHFGIDARLPINESQKSEAK